MSLLWLVWEHCIKLCKIPHEEDRYYKEIFFCTKLGHISKNCMNRGRVEDEKKTKANNIKK